MNTISIGKPLAVLAMLFSSSLLSFAQVSRSLGTLPPGGTVTITFDVTINTPFPPNTSSVTNQGSVSGTGFGPILTDDPATAPLNDPTITPITVAPQITCPADIIASGGTVCSLPSVPFAATVTAGVPAPTLTYKLGTTVITSPYTFPSGTNVVSVTAVNGTTPNASCSFKVIVPTTAPPLSTFRIASKVVLSWPTNFACYSLQSTPALNPAGTNWTILPGPFPIQGGYYLATNSITSTNQFFRLRH